MHIHCLHCLSWNGISLEFHPNPWTRPHGQLNEGSLVWWGENKLAAIRLSNRVGEHQTVVKSQIHQLQVKQGDGLEMQQVLEGLQKIYTSARLPAQIYS